MGTSTVNPTAVIADDEPLLRDDLREALAVTWPELRVLAEAVDGAEAIKAVDRYGPTVAFLDIHMPGTDGMEAAEVIQGKTQIVFVTAYDEHAVAAFEKGAVDYLLKPVSSLRLTATVARIRRQVAASSGGIDADTRAPLRWIQASSGKVLRFVPVEQICFFRSEDKYTKLVTAMETAMIRKSLKELVTMLDPEMFWQINRSTIVGLRHVESVVREDGEVTAKIRGHAEALRVSKAFQAKFRAM